ncbi:aryl-alcohol dehydrogenase-like predicted oxidoreductase [Pullulanibacillus pueri]|uniref:Aldo/keto reductase n=1 Tax=Pullulanibacillus pueri TaxID=1437324 RepID=A0A8J3EKG5_9BACL|nr:aldo/keto reductase [Pullulanibacillus pueri]MBM7680301.1 aryl-alcohol dehydrogenase-like predicted oxidoreductase [Pullulanibacillus pueri]GGH75767.1 aldo/keto reductase [Pullulanibacillus pueri]
METRALGRSGLKVTALCLGTMTFGNQADKATSFKIMDKAFDAGVNFFDTADMYPLGGSYEQLGATEAYIGEWLQGRRGNIVLASKCFGAMGPGANDRGLSRKHIMDAVEASLKRLNTDYLDLYQAHQFDPTTPIDETLRAFDDLVTQGKVRYIGVSNWRSWQVAKALGISERKNFVRIESVQPRYNLLYRMIEEELVPMAQSEGVGIFSYNPLAGGMLTGRYKWGNEVKAGTRFGLGGVTKAGDLYQTRYWQKATFDAVERYRQWCQEHDYDMVTTAVRWVTQQPGINAAIIGASRPEQLDASLKAADVPPLTEEDLKWLDKLWFSLPRRQEDR